jgi:exodeoxyribonuclease V alpha subunit
MYTINDVHEQFAEYFNIPALKPYAYLLSKRLSEGNVCLHLDTILDQLATLPEPYQQLLLDNRVPSSIPLIGDENHEVQPFILYNKEMLYLQRYYRYETTILQQIHQFLSSEKEVLTERLELLQKHKEYGKSLFTANVREEGSDTYDWQLAAVISGFLNNFTIITGGPGTGKTTTVVKLLVVLYTAYPNLKVALAAPTGKAAARMAESLRNADLEMEESIKEKFQKMKPATIHRLLKKVRESPYFVYNRDNPLAYDVVIVDECSMIDVALFAKLIEAVGPATRLILMGDKDQLASIEAGSLFGDICQAQQETNLFSPQRLQLINEFIPIPSSQIPSSFQRNGAQLPLFQHIVELRHSHRFSANKGIGRFSKAVIKNDKAILQEFLQSNADAEVVTDSSYSKDLFEKFISQYKAYIEEKDIAIALKKLNNSRVLCALREGPHGLNQVNRNIERYLSEMKLIRNNVDFYENRPLICTQNYYEHGLFNGDTGIIRPDANGILMAWFEDSNGGVKAILPGFLAQAETVYAMTIHKSQGSEFSEVLVILPESTDVALLTSELLYTAVTRAKRKVYLQGSGEVILLAAGRRVERASGVTERLNKLN